MNKLTPLKKSQVQIEFTNLDTDKAAIGKILLAAMSKFGLYDNTETSRAPDTIKSIVEAEGFGFGIGARVVKNSIFVDFNRGKNYSPQFEEIHDFILSELQNTFHSELQEIWEDSSIYCKSC